MMCRECGPVSLRGRILCPDCCAREEERAIRVEERKTLFYRTRSFRVTMAVFGFVILAWGVFYLAFLMPRMVDVTADDQERIQFYLDLAYRSGKGTETFERQMDNISRLDMSYSHLLTYLRQGEEEHEEGRYREAIEHFKKVGKMLPKWSWIHVLMANSYLGLDLTEHAKNELEQAIELNPDDIRAYMILGRIYASEDEVEDAVLQFSKALFIDKRNPEVLLALAELYMKQNRFIKAREYRDRAHELGANTERVDALLSG